MKKILLSLVVMCSLFMVSCGNTAMLAAAAFYMEDIKAGEYEKFLNSTATPLDADTKAFYIEQLEATADQVGAITDYEIASAVTTEAGDQAQVVFTVTYESGDVIEYPMTLQKVGGDWKIAL